jgi:hypothetical protein
MPKKNKITGCEMNVTIHGSTAHGKTSRVRKYFLWIIGGIFIIHSFECEYQIDFLR